MLTTILIAVAVVLAAFLVFVALRPAEYTVTRSARMAAPPSIIFALVNDLRRFNDYSPWAHIDADTKYTYDGPPAGPGASISWVGNNKVGAGRMSIIASEPNERIEFKLEFFKPMAGVASSDWTFKAEGPSTLVTWSMSGKNSFIAKAMCLFMNMDKMLGGQFEQGLGRLRTLVEAETKG